MARTRPGGRAAVSRCACPADSSPACGPATHGDPLLRQVLPLGAELDDVPGYGGDPVGDLASRAGPGVLHKYAGRALLVTTGACAINCRYCFRRHFPLRGRKCLARRIRPGARRHCARDASITKSS